MEKNRMDEIIRQNEEIIKLLGRIAFKPESIREVVTKGKRDADRYVEGYNACDGNKTVTEIAGIIGITHGTLSPILQSWAELGIVREIVKKGGTYYKRIMPI